MFVCFRVITRFRLASRHINRSNRDSQGSPKLSPLVSIAGNNRRIDGSIFPHDLDFAPGLPEPSAGLGLWPKSKQQGGVALCLSGKHPAGRLLVKTGPSNDMDGIAMNRKFSKARGATSPFQHNSPSIWREGSS